MGENDKQMALMHNSIQGDFSVAKKYKVPKKRSWLAEKMLMVYIIWTLLMGKNVMTFFHLDLKIEGFIANIHYVALPILFIPFIKVFNKGNFYMEEKALMITSVLMMLFQKLIMCKDAGLVIVLNCVVEPFMLLFVLRSIGFNVIGKIRKVLVLFLIVEALVALYEYFTNNLVFADPTSLSKEMMLGLDDMRAYGLHGHPLQNAFMVSIIMTVIIFSKLSLPFRYGLFFIGYISLFCFNTRSSIYFMLVILFMAIWKDFIISKYSLSKRVLFLLIIGISIFYFLDFVVSNNLGSRLHTKMNAEDSSSNARFLLVDILLKDLNLFDFLVGITIEQTDRYMVKYSMIAIENSVLDMIFFYGIIYTILFFYFWYKKLIHIQKNRLMTWGVLLIMFLLFNTNNAIMANTPLFPTAVIALFCYGSTPEGTEKWYVRK